MTLTFIGPSLKTSKQALLRLILVWILVHSPQLKIVYVFSFFFYICVGYWFSICLNCFTPSPHSPKCPRVGGIFFFPWLTAYVYTWVAQRSRGGGEDPGVGVEGGGGVWRKRRKRVSRLTAATQWGQESCRRIDGYLSRLGAVSVLSFNRAEWAVSLSGGEI